MAENAATAPVSARQGGARTAVPTFLGMALLGWCAQYAWFEVAERWLPLYLALGASLVLSYGLMGWLALGVKDSVRRDRVGFRAIPNRSVPALVLLVPVSLVAIGVEAAVHAPLHRGRAIGAWDWHGPVLGVASSNVALLGALFVVVVVMPLALEFFFRGVVQTGLAAAVGPVGGTACAAAAYAAAIAGLRTEPITFTMMASGAFVAGLVFGAIRQVTGSVWAAAAVHAAASAVFAVFQLLADSSPVPFVTANARAVPTSVVAPAIVSAAIGCVLLFALRPRRTAIPNS